MKALIDSIDKKINQLQKNINAYSLNADIQQEYVDSLHSVLSNYYKQRNNLEATLFINTNEKLDIEKIEKRDNQMLVISNKIKTAQDEYNEADEVLSEIKYDLSAASEQKKQLIAKKEVLIAESTATEYFENLTGVQWVVSPKYGKDKLVSPPFSEEIATKLANLINKIAENNYATAIKSPRGKIYRVFMNKNAVIQDSLNVTRAKGFLWSQFHSFEENIAEQRFEPMSAEEELAATHQPRRMKLT